MFVASIDSGFFLLLLFLTPVIFFLPARGRALFFLFINIAFYIFTAPTSGSLLGICLFVFLPYIYIQFMLQSRWPAWPIIVALIVAFIYLNGYNWLLDPVLDNKWLLSLNILGLSYILFRQLDVIINVSGGRVSKVPLITYLNYQFSFWTIMAGPIQRFNNFRDDFESAIPVSGARNQLPLFHRAATGMLKVLLFAMLCKKISDASFAQLSTQGPNLRHLLQIFYLYPLYVYLNFSGYCDIVISLAQWAGFTIPENFSKPYLQGT